VIDRFFFALPIFRDSSVDGFNVSKKGVFKSIIWFFGGVNESDFLGVFQKFCVVEMFG